MGRNQVLKLCWLTLDSTLWSTSSQRFMSYIIAIKQVIAPEQKNSHQGQVRQPFSELPQPRRDEVLPFLRRRVLCVFAQVAVRASLFQFFRQHVVKLIFELFELLSNFLSEWIRHRDLLLPLRCCNYSQRIQFRQRSIPVWGFIVKRPRGAEKNRNVDGRRREEFRCAA